MYVPILLIVFLLDIVFIPFCKPTDNVMEE